METLRRISWSQSYSSSSTWWTSPELQEFQEYFSLALWKEPQFFQGGFAYKQHRFPCKRRGCKQHTAPSAFVTCHTRNFSRRAHVALDDSGILLNVVCLSTVFLTFLYIFSYTCTWFVYLSLAVIPVDESIHCPSARRVMLWPTG